MIARLPFKKVPNARACARVRAKGGKRFILGRGNPFGVVEMVWKNVIVLNGLAKKREKVQKFIADRFRVQMSGSNTTITDAPDGLRIATSGSWCESKGRIKVAEHDSDLLVTLMEESSPLSNTWLIGCLGVWFLGILAIVVYFVYENEKKQMLENFSQNAESAVKAAESDAR